jgi:hypothetical protein
LTGDKGGKPAPEGLARPPESVYPAWDFGTSADDEVTWASSLECCGLGTGSRLVRDDLPPGTHRITLVASDGQDGETSASVWIKVTAEPAHDEC